MVVAYMILCACTVVLICHRIANVWCAVVNLVRSLKLPVEFNIDSLSYDLSLDCRKAHCIRW